MTRRAAAVAWLAIVVAAATSGDVLAAPVAIRTGDEISLREYVDIRFDAQEKAVQSALASAERAVAKAELASDKRFDAVNEFRAQLADQARNLMPRTETESQFKSFTEKINGLTDRVNAMDTRKQAFGDGWGYLVGAAGILAAIVIPIYFRQRPQSPLR